MTAELFAIMRMNRPRSRLPPPNFVNVEPATPSLPVAIPGSRDELGGNDSSTAGGTVNCPSSECARQVKEASDNGWTFTVNAGPVPVICTRSPGVPPVHVTVTPWLRITVLIVLWLLQMSGSPKVATAENPCTSRPPGKL